ncbi:TRAP transporter small permease subunit [Enterovibrio makurazakiensis]|uniref:TRAP transporter small permease subunit n=1 Tax=Enterovibrio makurazakiensis TaxID=2910232 RepID=UPI003D24E66E
MQFFIGFSETIDRVMRFLAMFGGWLGVMLIVAVCYDVVTRYFGVPKPAGINSTMIQESEYWLHSFLIVFSIGYAYLKNAHVRVDLFRPSFSLKTKLWIELIGLLTAVIPYSLLGIWLAWPYTVKSYLSGEISKSQNGLSDLWILKGGLVVLFVLIFFAGLSKLIKIIAALRGDLSMEAANGEEL